jgi:hypothetical protein
MVDTLRWGMSIVVSDRGSHIMTVSDTRKETRYVLITPVRPPGLGEIGLHSYSINLCFFLNHYFLLVEAILHE